ncbi:hypothetical protein PG995_014382 [Apiospora arundinis]|uniref:Heterokaryon incompatibility domain-containing protein n=1 Tax=Apiospora arundinis TaxID=335852 RepID=A0ABR2IJ37_9PEZI
MSLRIDEITQSKINQYAQSKISKYDEQPRLGLGFTEVDGHFCDYLDRYPGYQDFTCMIRQETLHDATPRCCACHLLVEAIDQQVTNSNWDNVILAMVGTHLHDTFFVTGVNRVTGEIEHSSPFFLFSNSDISATALFPFRVTNNLDILPCDTSSNDSLVWAKEQIKSCLSEHNCSSDTRRSSLPTRVLDLFAQGGQGMIKLLITNQQRAPYTCLSHCWGNTGRMTKTTTDNLKSRLEGINIADLPRTFRDAVDITRRLGIQYLWIDSLCIIQDCDQDWRSEARRMADIYEGSYVTIAATDSADGDGGCYRHLEEARCSAISVTGDGGKRIDIYSRQPHQHFNISLETAKSSRSVVSPLLKRCWVFQERLLSPRVLHFCSRELLFECRAGNKCQCGEREFESGLKETFAQLLVGDAALDSHQTARGWWAITRQYSQLQLTFRKDVLLALSGIARRIGDTRPADEYLAGIWKSTLPYSLLWYVQDENLDKTADSNAYRTPGLHIPSWSWASANGRIRWELPGPHWNQHLVEVKNAQCTTDTGDGYGQIRRSSLRLTGPTLFSILTRKPSKLGFGDGQESGILSWYLPELSEITKSSSYSFYPDHGVTTEQASPISVLCLWFKPNVMLVLKGAAGGKFERIGLLRQVYYDYKALATHELRQRLRTIELV